MKSRSTPNISSISGVVMPQIGGVAARFIATVDRAIGAFAIHLARQQLPQFSAGLDIISWRVQKRIPLLFCSFRKTSLVGQWPQSSDHVIDPDPSFGIYVFRAKVLWSLEYRSVRRPKWQCGVSVAKYPTLLSIFTCIITFYHWQRALLLVQPEESLCAWIPQWVLWCFSFHRFKGRVVKLQFITQIESQFRNLHNNWGFVTYVIRSQIV